MVGYKCFWKIVACVAMIVCASSCRNEDVFVRRISNRIGLQVQDGTATKGGLCGELLCSVPFETDGGEHRVLSVYIGDAADGESQTKGLPIYTSNIGKVEGYKSFGMCVWQNGDPYQDPLMQSMGDVTAVYDADSLIWALQNGPYYWPEDPSADITFCARAPLALNGTLSSLVWESSLGKASFSYEQPAPGNASPYMDAVNQQDILFAINTQNKSDNVRGKESYAKIHFHHALTSVKFTRGADLNDCRITDVVFSNFYGSGDAVFDPAATPEYVWSNQSGKTTYRQTFDSVLDSSVARADDDSDAGASLDPTVRDSNPANDGEYTFMMIPQILPSDAAISIYIEGRIHPIELYFGKSDLGDNVGDGNVSRLRDWSTYAGKVITIRVESKELELVRVAVDDEVEGLVKSNVTTANTGINGVYMRAALIANCLNSEGMMIRPCKIGDTDHPDNIDYAGDGVFTKASDWSSYWMFNEDDGFYYYKYVVPAGEKTYVDLFETFTLNSDLIGSETGGVNVSSVVFDVVLQGVDAGLSTYSTVAVTAAHWPADIVSALSTEAKYFGMN